MANDNLRAALQNAGLQPEELADIVQVDVRSVRRWLAGGAPYARHRGKIARALDTTQQQLWPQIAPPAINDALAAYAHANDPDAPTTETLIEDATELIDLLDHTLTRLLAQPGLSELILAKASQGCHIRIVLAAPDESLRSLLAHQQIEIKPTPSPVDPVIHRVDDQMLIAVSLASEPSEPPVVLHLREHRAPRLFGRLARHYENEWQRASESIKTDHDLDVHLREHEQRAGRSSGDRDTSEPERQTSTAPIRQPAEAPPRHWPRRPSN